MHNKGNGYVMTCHHAITRSARRLFSGWAELKLDVHTQEKRKRENEKASEKEKWTVIMSWWVICQYPGQFWWKERERQVTWEERRMLETLHAVRMSVLNTDDWVKRESVRPCSNISANKSHYLQAYSFTRLFEPCRSASAHSLSARFTSSELCWPTLWCFCW